MKKCLLFMLCMLISVFVMSCKGCGNSDSKDKKSDPLTKTPNALPETPSSDTRSASGDGPSGSGASPADDAVSDSSAPGTLVSPDQLIVLSSTMLKINVLKFSHSAIDVEITPNGGSSATLKLSTNRLAIGTLDGKPLFANVVPNKRGTDIVFSVDGSTKPCKVLFKNSTTVKKIEFLVNEKGNYIIKAC